MENYEYIAYEGFTGYASTYGQNKKIIPLSNIDFSKLKLVPPMVGDKPKWLDYNKKEWRNLYVTDGGFVIYNGVIVKNLENEPPVDAASFVQSSNIYSYAMDKNSVYYAGKRSAQLETIPRIALDKLVVIDGNYLTDGTHLYINGQYLGENNEFKLIKSKNYGHWCRPNLSQIASNKNFVFIDDSILKNADAKSFQIKRWIPELDYLSYTDKNGEHLYTYGKDSASVLALVDNMQPEQGLFLTKDKVFYVVSKDDDKPIKTSQMHEAKGVDPEKVIKMSEKIITEDLKKFYIFKNYFFNSGMWKTIDAINYKQLNHGMMLEDQDKIYFVDDSRGIYATHQKSGNYRELGKNFGRDDKYVYIAKTGKRFRTKNPEKACINSVYMLITSEGLYDEDGRFSENTGWPCGNYN